MARRRDDSSYNCRDWSSRKLVAEIRRISNMVDFGMPAVNGTINGDTIREATRVYRNTWLEPLLDEMEARLIR